MQKLAILVLGLFFNINTLFSQHTSALLPDSLFTGNQGKFHVQGMAVDSINKCVYFSFTNSLVKLDLSGQMIGSVVGFSGHLGDLDFFKGKVYGSLEYKGDKIGKGISEKLGQNISKENGFYIAIFDGDRIVRHNMNAETEGILKTVYLAEPTNDFEDSVRIGDKNIPHRYACSGIDGLTFGPALGDEDTTNSYLYVAYGIYGDTTRQDNDYQIILQYDINDWEQYYQPLSISKLHRSGPEQPRSKYFIKTGNTTYGIQNLAYDSYSKNFYAMVYPGKKTNYPNYNLFVIDGQQGPVTQTIDFNNNKEKVEVLTLVDSGNFDLQSGISGWNFKWGATGLCPLRNGDFYISHNNKTEEGEQQTTIYKYKWTGNAVIPFVKKN